MEFNYDIDKEHMGSILAKFPQQCWDAIALARNITIEAKIKNVVVVGMGASGIAGDILKNYLGVKLPIKVVKDYDLPEWVNSNTLVFVLSYSGQTEEPIAALRTAIRKSAQVVSITSNGKVKEIAKKMARPLVLIPKDIPPRCALGYLFIPMLVILSNSKIIDDRTGDIKNMIDSLRNIKFKEKAQELAEKIYNKIPIIYTSNKLDSIAKRWKEQFNENAKTHAFTNVFPEVDHNEIMGYKNLNGEFIVLMLKDEDDKFEIKERMTATKNIISEKVPVREIIIRGNCLLTKIFSAIHLGDLVSYYLALLYEVDPTPVQDITLIKQGLA